MMSQGRLPGPGVDVPKGVGSRDQLCCMMPSPTPGSVEPCST